MSNMLKFQPRLYQQMIFNTAASKNTLVVLPTGLGKTNVFLMLAAHRLKTFPNSKILMLAPTKPLASQHLTTARNYLDYDKDKMIVLTGEIAPKKRIEEWKSHDIIFSTPQTVENDLIAGRINLKDVSLICFDECHRAVGDYAYTWIAKQYVKQARFPRILGLTASPGSDLDKIMEVAQNLFIEDIEVRTDEDADVKPYIKDIKITKIEVELPEEFRRIKKILDDAYNKRLNEIKDILGEEVNIKTKKDIINLQLELHSRIKTEGDFNVMTAVSRVAEILKLQHASELLETQGVNALYKYMKKLYDEARVTRVKAVKNLVKDENFKSAFYLVEELKERGIEHPKIPKLIEIVSELLKKPDVKIIIFNQYRDSAKKLEDEINKIGKAKLFVGQTKKNGTGLSQKKQKEILDDFSKGVYNVLISTSIGEEGLDIPKVDVVIFYEPVPSAIRTIQRRGRTGRHEQGKMILLITKGTRDEAYRWVSFHKEKRMYRILREIKKKIRLKISDEIKQPTLSSYFNEESVVKIIADFREKNSPILKLLHNMGARIEIRNLDTGDYVCSNDVAVELKTREDFVNSIIDRRIIMQARALRNNFNKPLFVIYGTDNFSMMRMINDESIYAMISTLALKYRIPVVSLMTAREVASFIFSVARLEQGKTHDEISLHYNKPLTLVEQQEYLISALPGIGAKIAKPLLKHFGSIRAIANATVDELMQVPLIGKIKAERIHDVLNKDYKKV